MATKTQYERVQAILWHASEQGAKLASGGSHRPANFDQGFYIQPTLFTEVEPSMEIAQEEVFGPVLAVMAYDEEEQAMQLANSTRYGLSGAVWSSNAARALAFSRQMKTGQVVINGAAQNLVTPFGGWGWSGFGRENGRFGIEDLLNYRSLHGA